MTDYLDAMDINFSESVLDLGCGTGVAARQIAGREKFNGSVLGIDLSPHLVKTAEQLAAQEGLTDKTSFKVGDTRSLDLADATFDATVAHTLLGHVADPISVLLEIKRIVKPGAMIGVFDGDYASLTFAQENEEKWKADDEKIVSAIATQPRVARQMPILARAAGLELVRAFPYVLTEAGQADFWMLAIESLRVLIPGAGLMTESEAKAWYDALIDASDQGVFFGSGNYYGYVLKCP